MESARYCVFCRIVSGETGRILYQDERVFVFESIHPIAKHHYLVCPCQHIPNAKSLTSHDIPMVEHMLSVGKVVLQQQQTDLVKARFGFHWPPFCSINHLHLHVISPYDRIKPLYRLIGSFSPWMPWFKSVNWLIRRLRSSEKKSLKAGAVPVGTNDLPCSALPPEISAPSNDGGATENNDIHQDNRIESQNTDTQDHLYQN